VTVAARRSPADAGASPIGIGTLLLKPPPSIHDEIENMTSAEDSLRRIGAPATTRS
jgi:hypothetical protein